MKRSVAVFGLLCPFLTGCPPLAYLFWVTPIPPTVMTRSGEVYAFRAGDSSTQVLRESRDAPGLSSVRGVPCKPPDNRSVLRDVPLLGAEQVSPDAKGALDRAWVWGCVAIQDGDRPGPAGVVRLYRPGWQTVEITGGEREGAIDWREAPDAEAQEQAVDRLLLGCPTAPATGRAGVGRGTEGRGRISQPVAVPDPARLVSTLARGSASTGHQFALLFAAGEYERVAHLPDASAESRRRLAKKAATLRELAAR